MAACHLEVDVVCSLSILPLSYEILHIYLFSSSIRYAIFYFGYDLKLFDFSYTHLTNLFLSSQHFKYVVLFYLKPNNKTNKVTLCTCCKFHGTDHWMRSYNHDITLATVKL